MKTIPCGFYSILILTLVCISNTSAWDNEDLEIFDLVELINLNFYTVLGIQQDASLSEVKKAFRGLSITLHPDKNSAEDADVQFRNLVSIYEVLKDAVKRQKYDEVLKNGLPNWKSAIYYYRKARKMGLLEGALLIFVITTIGQYLVSWAVYFEKKFTMAQLFESKSKKVKKSNIDVGSILNEIPRPSVMNTLPFQIPIICYRMVVGTPQAIKGSVNLVAEEVKKELERKRKEKEEEERQLQMELERQQMKEERKEGLRRRKEQQSKLLERTDEELALYSAVIKPPKGQSAATTIPISGGLWTDADLIELARLIKKYPGGSVDRWETIAQVMKRNVSEVTFMAHKLKENITANLDTEKLVDQVNKELLKKNKKKPTVAAEPQAEGSWSQDQQKALEAAIQKHPQRSDERWDKIASAVPGKTKEQCLSRYKYLVELVKQQNAAKQQQQEEDQEKTENQKLSAEPEPEQDIEEVQSTDTSGKKRNLRKLRKKNVDHFYDEDGDSSD